MWNLDGTITFLGRIDEQVKIRGLRVELGEIDAVLRSLDYVRNCAVIAREDEGGSKAIFAYIVSDSAVDLSKVRVALATKLPDYMVPGYMMQVDEIPVTRNGKLDRRALPEIVGRSTQEFVEPTTEAEHVICSCFESVLSVQRVGVTDRFYDLGGDSIKAISLMSLLKQEVRAGQLPEAPAISIVDIISLQTPQQLAQMVATGLELCEVTIPLDPIAGETDYYVRRPSLERAAGTPVAANFVQQLFLDETPEATIIGKVAVPKRVGVDALVGALERVVVGTVFEYAYDLDAREFVRYPHARDHIDVYHLKEEVGDLLTRSYSHRPYRLDGRTLLSELFVWNPREGTSNFVYYCVSHAIWDGVSSEVFRSKLCRELFGEGLGARRSELPTRPPADAGIVSGKEYMACVDAFSQAVGGTQSHLSLEEMPVDFGQRLAPIKTVMGAYVRANVALRPLPAVPLIVLSNGRDASNGSMLGNFLKPLYAIFDTSEESITYVEAGAFEGSERALRERLLCVPLVNYLGVLDTEDMTDDYLTLRREGRLEPHGAGTSITANVEGSMMVMEYPVYATEV